MRASSALFVLILTASLGSGCSDKKTDPGKSLPPPTSDQSGGDEQETLPTIDEEAVKLGVATLSQGAMTAMGLSIPKGMLPGKAPEKVYRFEGTYPVVHVAGFVREQVRTRAIEKEGNGYLMRNARVRHPKGNSTGKERLAIRVFKGNKGGGTIDIWLEEDFKKVRAGGSSYSGSHASRYEHKTKKLTPTARKKRTAAKRETYRIMRKIARGEKLTVEEMESYH